MTKYIKFKVQISQKVDKDKIDGILFEVVRYLSNILSPLGITLSDTIITKS